jgi:hypothetical protein
MDAHAIHRTTGIAGPAGLAGVAASVVGSGPMIEPNLDATSRMQRAKERLYVLCQLGGWGGAMAVQTSFYFAVGRVRKDPVADLAQMVIVVLSGFILSHLGRHWVGRWDWKKLAWAALLPRVLGLAMAMSGLWTLFGFGFLYGVLRLPWEQRVPMVVSIAGSLLNGTLIFIFWFCIYFMYHAFGRLQRMQVEQLRLAATVKEAELRALKSQVNPHFLFNSLNSLRALIDEDAPRAREVVTRLANILRYSLQSGQQPTVPLAQEIEVVKDYLALEQIRHEQRLRVSWSVAAESLAVPVPPMLLQTLVENAVKYGIGTRREGGEVAISADVQAGALRLRVVNPGELGSARGESDVVSTGVGLRNAAERMTLLHGDRASLSLRAEPPGHVTAEVLIPLNASAS